jgi:hypothetical protein
MAEAPEPTPLYLEYEGRREELEWRRRVAGMGFWRLSFVVAVGILIAQAINAIIGVLTKIGEW